MRFCNGVLAAILVTGLAFRPVSAAELPVPELLGHHTVGGDYFGLRDGEVVWLDSGAIVSLTELEKLDLKSLAHFYQVMGLGGPQARVDFKFRRKPAPEIEVQYLSWQSVWDEVTRERTKLIPKTVELPPLPMLRVKSWRPELREPTHTAVATILSLVPGVGQISNLEIAKGIFYLGAAGALGYAMQVGQQSGNPELLRVGQTGLASLVVLSPLDAFCTTTVQRNEWQAWKLKVEQEEAADLAPSHQPSSP